MSHYEFKLPDIGEGLTEGELVAWHVKVGDSVKENQPLCNILTDKAEVEIPSPKAGKIAGLAAKPGEKVKVHATLVTFDLAGDLPPKKQDRSLEQERRDDINRQQSEVLRSMGGTSNAPAVQATPAVRKLASSLKIEISNVRGTGPGGRITEDDVRKAAGSTNGSAAPHAAPSAGPEERIPFVGIRRRTAEKMAEGHRNVAAVTHMDEADVTALVSLRAEMKPEAEKRGVKLTYLPFIIRALVKVLKEFPNLNASLDEAAGVLVHKRFYNIGIATQAEHGLMVPVLKDADKKDVWGLAAEIQRLADKTRAGKIELSELQGGTFTVTNIGAIGGLFATPIVNLPETGVLGVMKIEKRPAVVSGQVQVRDKVNLVLTFDHRVLDGAEAASFTASLIKHLENPRTLL